MTFNLFGWQFAVAWRDHGRMAGYLHRLRDGTLEYWAQRVTKPEPGLRLIHRVHYLGRSPSDFLRKSDDPDVATLEDWVQEWAR